MADIARLVLTRGVRLGLWGTAVGLVGAAVLARLLASAVPSLGAGRPSIIVAVWCLLMGVVLLACWAPALRASRVDPAVAVRYE
jgi:ABC-type lipoprotein release transport system permease subunit